MKTLIVDDDFTNRLLLQELLKSYGPVHVAVDGVEAVKATRFSLDSKEPYDLICLDIMMPKMDGQEALAKIRQHEEEVGINFAQGSRILMTTALNDMKNMGAAFNNLCDGYLVKPINKSKLVEELKKLKLI